VRTQRAVRLLFAAWSVQDGLRLCADALAEVPSISCSRTATPHEQGIAAGGLGRHTQRLDCRGTGRLQQAFVFRRNVIV
jgi:hypothetical protein